MATKKKKKKKKVVPEKSNIEKVYDTIIGKWLPRLAIIRATKLSAHEVEMVLKDLNKKNELQEALVMRGKGEPFVVFRIEPSIFD